MAGISSGAAVTRSREYTSNDNAHVEQKNNAVVRRYLEYGRLDCYDVLSLLNEYYREILCPLLNHFYPSHKLQEKRLIGTKRRRIYGKPVTPYARVMASEHVSQEKKDQLKIQHDALDPVKLRRQEELMRNKIDLVMRQFQTS